MQTDKMKEAARLMEATDIELNRVHMVLRDAENSRPKFYPAPVDDDTPYIPASISVDGVEYWPSEHQYLVLSAILRRGDYFHNRGVQALKEATEDRCPKYFGHLMKVKKELAHAEANRRLRPDLEVSDDGIKFYESELLSSARAYANGVVAAMNDADKVLPPYDAAGQYLQELPKERAEA